MKMRERLRRDITRMLNIASEAIEEANNIAATERYQNALAACAPLEIPDGQVLSSVPTITRRVSTKGTGREQVENTIRENEVATAYVRLRLTQRPRPSLEEIFMELFETNDRRGVGVISISIFNAINIDTGKDSPEKRELFAGSIAAPHP